MRNDEWREAFQFTIDSLPVRHYGTKAGNKS